MADFVHYVTRNIVLLDYKNKNLPWFAKNQPDNQGLDRPFFHTTRKITGPSSRIVAGDTIWLFSQLHTPWGDICPALDAKIIVSQVKKFDNKFEYIADNTSSWFPLFDASKTLEQLRTKDSKNNSTPLLGCDLRLMPADTADDLVNKGRNLVIVALVSTKLHIRIFDANGKRVVDKTENELISGETLTTLKNQLNPLPDESGLSPEQKQKIIRNATSIAGHTLKKENLSVGFALRSIREIENSQPLLNLETEIKGLRFNFISYRLADGTKSAFNLCKKLLSDNIPIFWDRWSLPRRLAERREIIDDPALDIHIQQIIKNPMCNQVYGVESTKYGEAESYSEKEKNWAIKYKKFCHSPNF